jgi:hypothetical protein
MAIDRNFWVVVCLALGGGALTFAFLPGQWPVPVADGAFEPAVVLPSLRAAAAAVDAACARGDGAAFAAVTTSAHRDELVGRLAALDRQLDAATLHELAGQSVGDWLQQPTWAGVVRGSRTVVAVGRPGGDGAQLLAFEWDGRRWRFDGSHHQRSVRDVRGAQAAVDAVATRSR